MTDQSYGVITLTREPIPRVLLIKHVSGHWSFPKGHPEPGEAARKCALRELREETGLNAVELRTSEPQFVEAYQFVRDGQTVDKQVGFFLGFTSSMEVVIQTKEIADYRWCTMDEAEELITFKQARQVLTEVVDYLK